MNVQALREDEALSKLKLQLSASPNEPSTATDEYLLRFLRSKNYDVDETIAKLQRRRDFEKTLASLCLTPFVLSALRSGTFAIIGNDIMHRPVVYIRVALHRSTADFAEEKLIIVLLEYMQHLLYERNVPEFVVLVNEQGAGLFSSHAASPLTERLTVLLSKYYPELVGLVLVVNAGWAVTQGVKSSISSSTTRVRNRVLVLPRAAELLRYLNVSVVPTELGGKNNVSTLSPVEFAEAVVRYWYTVIAFLEAEGQNLGGLYARDIWRPLPSFNSSEVGDGVAAARHDNALRGRLAARSSDERRQQPKRSHPGGPQTPRAMADDNNSDDDGCCSFVSDTDAFRSVHGEPFRLSTEPAAAAASSDDAMSSLQSQLMAEVQHRKQLEEKIARLELGVTVEDSTITRLEAALRAVHEEVNILVGEVILKAKRERQGNPTLSYLLDHTDSALLQGLQERPAIPAMKAAMPMDRKVPSSCTML